MNRHVMQAMTVLTPTLGENDIITVINKDENLDAN